MHVAERSTDGVPRPAFCDGRKISAVEQALLWEELRAHPQGPSRPMMDRMAKCRCGPACARLIGGGCAGKGRAGKAGRGK